MDRLLCANCVRPAPPETLCDGYTLPRGRGEFDVGELLNVLIDGVPDASERRKILGLNPERRYGFDLG